MPPRYCAAADCTVRRLEAYLNVLTDPPRTHLLLRHASRSGGRQFLCAQHWNEHLSANARMTETHTRCAAVAASPAPPVIAQRQRIHLRTESKFSQLTCDFEAACHTRDWKDITDETCYPTTTFDSAANLVIPTWPPTRRPGPEDFPQVRLVHSVSFIT